ncbi:MAG: DUF4236 domain-containing protein [Steroidobacteraceae bacterium]
MGSCRGSQRDVCHCLNPRMSGHFHMGFRFRRSVKILPGIRLNFGKRGVSTSIGVRGAHITFGGTGTRTTVGLAHSGKCILRSNAL